MDIVQVVDTLLSLPTAVALVSAVFAGLTYWVMRDQLNMMRAESSPIVDFYVDRRDGVPILKIVIVNPAAHSIELQRVDVVLPQKLKIASALKWNVTVSGLAEPAFHSAARSALLQPGSVVAARSMIGAPDAFAHRNSESFEFLFVPSEGWTGGEVRLRLSILIREARSRRSSLIVSRDIRCDWNATTTQPNANAAVAIRKSSAIKSIFDSMSA